jgi:WD40 repeat protein
MPGKDLATILQKRGKLSAAEVWHVLKSLMPVIESIHAHKRIHQNIKPESILYSETRNSKIDSNRSFESGSITLVDWSTSPCASSEFSTLVSAEYAAPEQLAGNTVFASDLYSLGVTCIHLLTGLSPFDLMDSANNCWIWRTYWQQEKGERSLADTCQQLAEVLDRMIEPDLARRFPSALAVIEYIEALRPKTVSTFIKPPDWNRYATLIGHQGLFAGVNAVAIDTSNNRVASASADRTIRLWDLATGATQFSLKGHTHSVQCLAFSASSSRLNSSLDSILVSGSRDRTLKLWDLNQRQEMFTLIGHQAGVNAVAFSADGDIIASGSADKTVKLWNPHTGQLTATLTGAKLPITAIAFNPFAPILVGTSADSTIQVWDLTTLEQICTLTAHTAAVRAIAISPDGTILATGGEDRTIRLWNTACWQCIRVLPGHSWAISALTFMPNSKFLISGSWDKMMKIWQISTGSEIEVLKGHLDIVSGIAIAQKRSSAPDSFLSDAAISAKTIIASCSLDRTIQLWTQ